MYTETENHGMPTEAKDPWERIRKYGCESEIEPFDPERPESTLIVENEEPHVDLLADPAWGNQMTNALPSETPPAATLAFAHQAAEQLEIAIARHKKKAGISGSVSSAELASQMMSRNDLDPEADQAATASVSAGLDDMFGEILGNPAKVNKADSTVEPLGDNAGSMSVQSEIQRAVSQVVQPSKEEPAELPGRAGPGRDFFKELDGLL